MNDFIYILSQLEFFFQFFFATALFSLNLKRRSFFPLRLLASTLIVGGASFYWDWSWGLYLSALRYIVLYLLFFGAIYFLFDLNKMQSIFVCTSAYVCQHFAYQVSQLVWQIIFNIIGVDFWNYYAYVRIPYNVIIFGFVYLTLYFTYIEKITEQELEIHNKKWLIFGVVIVLTTIILNLATNYNPFSSIIFIIYSIIFCVIAVFSLLQVKKSDKLERDNFIIEKMLEMKQEYTDMSQASTELINIRCHDLKHQIAALKASTVDNEQEKEKLVQEIQDEIDLYDSFITTNIPALDVTLTQKAIFCQKNKIKFTAMVSVDSLGEITPRDIYSLFGNSIDNAIESVSKLDDPKKKIISLVIHKEDNELIIDIENYYKGELIFKDKLPVTQKKNKELHGYGLKSISYIVNKYNGSLNITTDKNIFTLEIKLPYVKNAK